jgi:hypothetical protein
MPILNENCKENEAHFVSSTLSPEVSKVLSLIKQSGFFFNYNTQPHTQQHKHS